MANDTNKGTEAPDTDPELYRLGQLGLEPEDFPHFVKATIEGTQLWVLCVGGGDFRDTSQEGKTFKKLYKHLKFLADTDCTLENAGPFKSNSLCVFVFDIRGL